MGRTPQCDDSHLPEPSPITNDDVQRQLQKILASPAFARSRRLTQFLQFTVELKLTGRTDEIKEQRIGAEVFERGSHFDPQVDTIVRTQAHRLRAALSNFYQNEGGSDPICIEFAKGSYVPTIRENVPNLPLSEVRLEPAIRPRLQLTALLVVMLLLMGVVAALGWWRTVAARNIPFTHLALPFYSPGVLNAGLGPAVISPGGRSVVFPIVEDNGARRLWMRSLESMNATGIAGSEDAILPFWSPDESEIGFFANGLLNVFRISDGSVRALCDAPLGRGGTWNRNGVILFTPRVADAVIYRTTSAGKVPVAVTRLDSSKEETDHRWPEFLEDGNHFVYTAHSRNDANGGIFLSALDGEQPTQLDSTLSQARHAFTPAGEYLLYVKGKEIRARKLNLRARRLEGPEVTLANGVSYLPSSGAAFSVSSDRYLLYHQANSQQTLPAVLDRGGNILRNLSIGGNPLGLVISRTGKRLAAEMAPGEQNETDIWVGDASGSGFLRVTIDGGAQAVWSRDGTVLLFVNPADTFTTLITRSRVEGESAEKPGGVHESIAWRSRYSMFPTDMSPDGRFLALHMINPGTQMDLYLLPLDPTSRRASGPPVLVRGSGHNESQGFFSADGSHLAYVSDETGQPEIYVEAIGSGHIGQGSRIRVSSGGGFHPRWRNDGSELFYLALDRSMMSVPVSTSGDSLKFGIPRKLFSARIFASENRSAYGVSPDGSSFYCLLRPDRSGMSQVSLLTGWTRLFNQNRP